MLSVLIPTYNFNCHLFVKEIHKQLIKEKVDFEIICFDDGSNSELNIENEKINLLEHSHFKTLGQNIGRSAIRNLLVEKSKYQWVLFLDSDGYPVKDNFINTYLNSLKKSDESISGFVGGRVHKIDSEKNLRINFGIEREEVPFKLRNINPYRFFFTSNIVLKRTIFNTIKFNENLDGYGYEDLVFGKEMSDKNYKILHINNPVYHLQIENNIDFINKTKQGLKNLFFLKEQKLIKEEDVKLLHYFKIINSLKLKRIMKNRLDFFIKKAIKTSSLMYYDLFKLSYLCYLNDENLKK